LRMCLTIRNWTEKKTKNAHAEDNGFGDTFKFTEKTKAAIRAAMEECQPDPKTGIRSYCLPVRNWKKGKILREFYPDIDSTVVEPTAKLMKNRGSGNHDENKLKLLEEETDYIAYDRNFKVIAAYFHSAYSRAVDERTAAEIMVMAQENIKQISEW
jgi:hypothetical protein